MKPLVSILICAYNADKTIADTLRSAVTQTWQHKEIIVVDDGSSDRTADVVRRFKGVTLISTENQGFSAAQNHVFQSSQGDYIQYLDADDLLAPDKIERQLAALREKESKRILLSSPWASFYYQTRNARFVKNSLCQDLSPVEWLLRKMSQGDHMQNATWLVSRELAIAAGPWDTRLHYDQDGEFFCRVLLASEGTRFVPGTGIYYRASGPNRISFIGKSDAKKDSLFLSMKLHIQYLRSLEESERVRNACLAYLQIWYLSFYPERPDIVAELQSLAAELGGCLEIPRLRWKYSWLSKIFGFENAKRAQSFFPKLKGALVRRWDRTLSRSEG
ncbi:MAG: glycosyltransferase family 2 protein [Ktedonobacteraceae bacterium]|nr:glycosyltransferase family 2 protein [Ktedonobacteraceae bacterium]